MLYGSIQRTVAKLPEQLRPKRIHFWGIRTKSAPGKFRLGQIQSHNPGPPFGDVFLGLLDGLVSTLSRTESITELRKQGIKVL